MWASTCVCVLGLGTLPQTPHELSGEPRSGAHAPCLWAWLTYPTADASGAPDTVLRAARPGGEEQGVCVCVSVSVSVSVSGAMVTPPHVVSPNSIQTSLQVVGGGVCKAASP